MATPMKTHITVITICASALFACSRTASVDDTDTPVTGVSDTEAPETDDDPTDTEGPGPDLPTPADIPVGDGDVCEFGFACIATLDGSCEVHIEGCPEGTVASLSACINAGTGECSETLGGACQPGWYMACTPDVGECACEDPGPSDDPGDCGCGIIGAGDSFCYHPFACGYFHGGCPEGWAAICEP